MNFLGHHRTKVTSRDVYIQDKLSLHTSGFEFKEEGGRARVGFSQI